MAVYHYGIKHGAMNRKEEVFLEEGLSDND